MSIESIYDLVYEELFYKENPEELKADNQAIEDRLIASGLQKNTNQFYEKYEAEAYSHDRFLANLDDEILNTRELTLDDINKIVTRLYEYGVREQDVMAIANIYDLFFIANKQEGNMFSFEDFVGNLSFLAATNKHLALHVAEAYISVFEGRHDQIETYVNVVEFLGKCGFKNLDQNSGFRQNCNLSTPESLVGNPEDASLKTDSFIIKDSVRLLIDVLGKNPVK